MRRVALYARVSTPDQDNATQLDRLRDMARSRGWEIAGEYADTASGANLNRPELRRLLGDARRRRFDAIAAVRLDRLARSVADIANTAEMLDSLGISMVLLDQPIDTSTSMGRFTRTILSAVAEIERELIRERTMDGLARARRSGHEGGRPARKLTPYQMDKARQILAENPEISNRALAAKFAGISRPTLIRELRDAGILRDGGMVH